MTRRVLVCGTNFGRLYVQAVQDHPELELAAILARGSAASRALADRCGVPLVTAVEDAPEVDLACVAVGSAVSGGPGTDIAVELLERGVHVLQEHPLHPDELTRVLRAARAGGAQYRLTTHHRHVAAVRGLLGAAAQLREREPVLWVDAAGPVHLLQPLVDILGRAVGGLRPWAWGDPAPRSAELLAVQRGGRAPLVAVDGVLGGVPVTLRVQNELHPADRDNHALLWPRIALGFDAGVLTLADLNGPVIWSPRMHAERDASGRLDLGGDAARRAAPTAAVLGDEPATAGELFDRLWPQAIGLALDELLAAVSEGADVLRSAQHDVTMTRAWADLGRRLGPPVSIERLAPTLVPVPSVARTGRPDGPDEDAPADPYADAGELFDLAASAHAHDSAEAVISALADVDLSAAPVLDLGAGTGLVGLPLARARPEMRLLAAEPSEVLRAVLTARVVDDPDLQRRVTVEAGAAPGLELPDRLSAVLLCGMLGHLRADERRVLWTRLRERLVPGGPIIVEAMGLQAGAQVERAQLARTTLGEQTYGWWFSAEPDEDGTLALETEWEVRATGDTPGDRSPEPRRTLRDGYRWDPVELAALGAEAGMRVRHLPGAGHASLPLAVLSLPD